MTKTVNITVNQGSTFSLEYTVYDNTGSPMDLTDFTVVSELKKMFNSYQAYPFTVDMPDPTLGVFTLTMDAELTAQIEGGRYVYDVEIENTLDQSITRVFDGIAICKAQASTSNPFIAEQGIKRTNPEAIHTHENREVLDTQKFWETVQGASKEAEWGDKMLIPDSGAFVIDFPENPEVGFEFEYITETGKYHVVRTETSWRITQVG